MCKQCRSAGMGGSRAAVCTKPLAVSQGHASLCGCTRKAPTLWGPREVAAVSRCIGGMPAWHLIALQGHGTQKSTPSHRLHVAMALRSPHPRIVPMWPPPCCRICPRPHCRHMGCRVYHPCSHCRMFHGNIHPTVVPCCDLL